VFGARLVGVPPPNPNSVYWVYPQKYLDDFLQFLLYRYIERGDLVIRKTSYPIEREDWGDYISQGCIMYCPPAQYSPDVESQMIKYSYFAGVSTRFLCSPQYTYLTSKIKDGLNLRGYALDNGAYLCHIKNKPFDYVYFDKYLSMLSSFADWVVLPDIVENRVETIVLGHKYLDILRERYGGIKTLFVWQDGMTKNDLLPFLRQGVGVFVGGSTEGKESSMSWIASLCRSFGVWCHVGRVNTLRRLEMVLSSGAHSFDGSGIVRFLPTLRLLSSRLLQERDQQSLFPKCKPITYSFLNSWLKRVRSL